MPKLFANSVDLKFSKYLEPIVEHGVSVTLTQKYLLSITELNRPAQQSITIPALDSLKLDTWPIGGYAHFYNTGGVACQFISAPGVIINGVTDAIEFDTSGYNTTIKLVRLGENKWLAELSGGGGGGGGGGGFSGALLESTGQTIPNNTTVKVSWGAEVYDTDSYHDISTNPTRITIPANVSKIRLTTQIVFADSATGLRGIRIKKNNSIVFEGFANRDWEPVSGVFNTSEFMQLITPVIEVVAGDYFEIETRQSSGGDLALELGNGHYCWFGVEKIE